VCPRVSRSCPHLVAISSFCSVAVEEVGCSYFQPVHPALRQPALRQRGEPGLRQLLPRQYRRTATGAHDECAGHQGQGRVHHRRGAPHVHRLRVLLRGDESNLQGGEAAPALRHHLHCVPYAVLDGRRHQVRRWDATSTPPTIIGVVEPVRSFFIFRCSLSVA
jgi:hypothetical protein